MAEERRVLFCECGIAELVPPRVRAGARQRLVAACVPFEVVPDLCELAARRDPRLKAIAEAAEPLIIACYPRAVRWLFAYAGTPLPESARIFNLRTQPPEALVLPTTNPQEPCAQAAKGAAPGLREQPGAEDENQKPRTEPSPPNTERQPPSWVPWFPVIDRSRCTGCQQCLNFCLFGVYALDGEGRVEVRNPANCKTNCPACARICPQVAIIFPKHRTSPINGDEVTPEHLASREVRVDPRSLGRGDVYAALRKRSERARAASEQAAQEQATQLCPCMLQELQNELGIPPEVLKTLPLGELQARLRAARAQRAT